MSRHYGDDDFMQLALYMFPRYMKRIRRYYKKYDRRHIENKKPVENEENILIDKNMLRELIKKSLLNPPEPNPKLKSENGKSQNDKSQDKGSNRKNGSSKKEVASGKTLKKEKRKHMYKSTTKVKVRYAETDKMGIAHHSNYYVWFEEARGDFIEKTGITYKNIEEKGIMMPIVETYCKYLNAAKYDDVLKIETSIFKLSPVRVSLEYKVKNNGKLIAKGKTSQTFIDKKFKIINIEREYPDLWEKFKSLE